MDREEIAVRLAAALIQARATMYTARHATSDDTTRGEHLAEFVPDKAADWYRQILSHLPAPP